MKEDQKEVWQIQEKKNLLGAAVINEGEEADSCQISVTANKSRSEI